MKAAVYREFGAAADVLKIEKIERPEPGPGEVRVRLAFSAPNPSDVKARAGTRPGVVKPAFPTIVPHSDGSGVIDAVGEGVDVARIGQRVWIWNGQWLRPFGTCAEYIALPQAQAVAMPDNVTFEQGAVLGIPGLTAAQAVLGGGDIAGEAVLISGGGGTVGYLAVQLAKWAGAKVIATGSPRDFDRISGAGADVVLDYRSDTLAADVLAANDGVLVDTSVEVEFGVNIAMIAEVMKPNGRVAIYGSALDMTPSIPFGPILFKALTLDVILIYLQTDADRAHTIAKLHDALAAGALSIPVQEVFALENVAKAQEAVEAGGRAGAVLIKL
ncbi:NADPH2:quinone reductase [Shimia gijangensis]|uniref:NADPH2:quinone reductase n=1 Tax=Shimia gijangensis TaxID=1470563 RepID=A0A1M6IJ10_9RHOB|nr:NADPH:quinone reductase [Shimia gijangensis]SHJ34460.1 NADPH2:quinone reductase [Shimia gijangensis]